MLGNTTFICSSEIPQQWQELNALWEKAQIPQKDFCKRHGISYGQFTNWRSKIVNERNKKQNQQRFAAVTLTEATPTTRTIPTITDAITVNFPDGTTLLLPKSLDANILLSILSALRGKA